MTVGLGTRHAALDGVARRASLGASLGAPPSLAPLARVASASAREDRLYFAQVREDPLVELEALRPALDGTVVVVGSGGCTALSLLAEGTGRVVSVDLNRTQHHLVELKAAACAALGRATALAFLGATPAMPAERRAWYAELRPLLTSDAARWWDTRAGLVGRGALDAGVSERLVRLIVLAMRLGVHPRARVERLLACRTLDEQRELYRREWDTRRWRLLFRVFLGRRALSGAYDPAFFDHVEHASFADHFLVRAAHALREVPVATNYFLRFMLGAGYPAALEDGVPPYLSERGVRALGSRRGALTLVDAPLERHLAERDAGSVDGFAISNIGEWLDAPAIDRLFAEVARTAAPGAVLVFRNFVGWTEVPERWRGRIIEDRELGARLIARDRSVVQRRVAVCRVNPEGA